MRRLRTLLVAATVAMGPLLASPALAYTPVSSLKDVSPNSWAYQSVKALVEKYEVMQGYPDDTFRGNQTVTRYQLAAALLRVMDKVQEMVSTATGQPVSVEPDVSPSDLATIARLQRELRDELEVLKGRVDTLDTRVDKLEKRLSWGGFLRAEYRDFTGSNPVASAPLAEYRVWNQLNLAATLQDDLGYHGALDWLVYGAQQPGDAFVTNGSTTHGFTEMFLKQSYVSYAPGWGTVNAGLVDASDVMVLGSTLKTPFAHSIWDEGTGGYGFVGTPGLSAPTAIATVSGNGASPSTANVWWLPGTDVVKQSLDPNAMQAIERSNVTAAASGDAGPFSLGVAYYQPDISGRDLTRLTSLGYPASFPQPETYLSPSTTVDTGAGQMLATLGGDFGTVRAQLAAKAPTFFGDFGTPDKTLAATVDIGSDDLGLSLQAVADNSFAPNRASATLASDDLFGTGFGLGLGMNTGTLLNDGESLSGPWGDYTSYGLYLRIPGFSVLPNLTLAVQQTADKGGPMGGTDPTTNQPYRALGSGITIGSDLAIGGWPLMQLEYSVGKFSPDIDNGLMNSSAPITNEQLTAAMTVSF
ncbi:MAG TPA: iron uptake porin [Oscillatoriaceae cyanobacterium]